MPPTVRRLLYRLVAPPLCSGFSLGCLFVASLFLLAMPLTSAAQERGTLAGVVVDGETGETLIGANVAVLPQDTTGGASPITGAATDLDGRYSIKVAAGTYNVRYTYIGYQRKTVSGVEVAAGETTRLEVSLSPDTAELDEVVVTAEVASDSEAGLLRQRQKAAGVSDAISAQTISQSGSSNAADAMSKVTGASVTDGKYVNVRGLGGRYVNTELNGADLPSADPNRNTVPLDLFPAGLLDNIVTSKTFTPDKPGNFTGGNINIGTKSFPEQLTFSLSSSVTYNTEVQFGNEATRFVEGEADVPAFEGTEVDQLDDDFFIRSRNPERLGQITRSFSDNLTPVQEQVPVIQSYSASFGNEFSLFGDVPLGVVASLSVSQNATVYDDGQSGLFTLSGNIDESDSLVVDQQLADRSGRRERQLGSILNVSIKPTPNNEISLNGIFNVSRQQSGRSQEGEFIRDLSDSETFRSRALEEVNRQLLTLQGRGNHVISPLSGLRVQWNSTYSQTTQEEPDVRFFNDDFEPPQREGDRPAFNISTSIYPAPTRYFRDLSEWATSNDLSFELPVGVATVKAGGRYVFRDRELDESRFIYDTEEFYEGAPDYFFEQCTGIVSGGECNGTVTDPSGLEVNYDLREGALGASIQPATEAQNNFVADREVIAGFGMIDTPLSFITDRLRVITGVRVESTDQTVESDADSTGSISVVDVLPSANLVYAVTDNMNIRAAYGRTLARPSFREFAPFFYFDFLRNEVTVGQPNLDRALINNFDLRWEWFLRPGELLAASVFYKNFNGAIVRSINPGAINREVSYRNSDALAVGAEFEARKRLDTLSDLAGFLQYVEVGGNFTLSYTEEEIPEGELQLIRAQDPDAEDTRQLQGQSPYIINLNAAYVNPETATNVALYYNYFDDRLDTVTRGGTPNIFEKGRHSLDFISSQGLVGNLTLKFSVKNIFDQRFQLIQTFNDVEYVATGYPLGRSITLGLAYDL